MNELPPKARAFLEAAARADEPSAAERARSERVLRSALAAHGLTGLPPLAAGEPALKEVTGTKLPAARLGLPLKVGVAVLALAGAAYLGRTTLSRSTPAAPQPSATGAPTAVEGSAAPLGHSRPAAPASLADREDRSAPSTSAPPPGVRPALSRVAPERVSRRPNDDLAEQLKTLETANNLVREGDFTAALHLLDRSESASASVLREERRGLRVLARCGAAPDAVAQRERDAFLRQYPRSVLAERVRGACTAKPHEAR